MARRRRTTSPITKTRGTRSRVALDQLKVGDAVRLLFKPDWEINGPRVNQSGIVRETDADGGGLGVEFFRRFEGGHELGGTARDGHGWYISRDHRMSRFTTPKRGRRAK